MWNLRWNEYGTVKRQGSPRSPAQQSEYSKRDVLLREMGFASYREYLASDLWQVIRLRVLTGPRGGRRGCCMCPKRASQVHHDRYTKDNLSGKSQAYMRPVCRGCHEVVEFKKSKGKRKKLQPATVRSRVKRKTKRRRVLVHRALDRRAERREIDEDSLPMAQEFAALVRGF